MSDKYYESSERANTKFSRRQQYRVRRIDGVANVCLESLSWERDMCSLRQTIVPSSEVAKLKSEVLDEFWAGKWFHKKTLKHSLAPSLEIHFDRAAWSCDSLDGEIRLTVDRNIRAHDAGPIVADRAVADSPVVVATNLVRMDFSVSLPSIFKALIYEFALLPERPTVLLECAKSKIADAQAVEQGKARARRPAANACGDARHMLRQEEVAICQLG